MVYHCKHCGFLFHRFGPVQSCPACEGQDIHPATAEEAAQFQEQLEGSPRPEGETI